jgi:hypothetical protein
MMMRRGETLIAQLLAGEGTRWSGTELLKEVRCGFPVEELVPLFESTGIETLQATAFVLSELGSAVGPSVFARIGPLLQCHDPGVVADSLDVVLTNACLTDGRLVADALELLDSVNGTIRYFAINFLWRCAMSELQVALQFLSEPVRYPLTWFVSTIAQFDAGDPTVEAAIEARLLAAAAVVQAAAAAAARRIHRGDDRLLLAASRLENPAVKRFAEFELRSLAASMKAELARHERELKREPQRKRK